MSTKAIDRKRIERAVREILLAIGEDPEREGLRETPRRVAEMYEDILGGVREDGYELIRASLFTEKHSELVLLRGISFFSICEHHLLPFMGVAHIAYIAKGQIVGLSTILRAFSQLCRQPQIQERLTWQMADMMYDTLKPHGVAVVLEARHLCMELIGVKKPGTIVTTSALRGIFHKNEGSRQELFKLIQGRDKVV
ncbi:MAG: GTP cyclohydrolase I FolE [Planctomycetales bacterium 4484_113]|nr:MAG: GTP cyclohydrolase I FolE [Planctomycetales bacterium 4484_113]